MDSSAEQMKYDETVREGEVDTPPEHPRLTPSVDRLIHSFDEKELQSAATLAQWLLDNHTEYGSGYPRPALQQTPIQQPARGWLEAVLPLFDYAQIQRLSGQETVELHGRLMLVGLALLEPELRLQLQQDGLLDALIREIKEPLDEMLSAAGQQLQSGIDEDAEEASVHYDSVPNQPDHPLATLAEDQLGRDAYARYLAQRIRAIPADSGAYCVHLYGPWGSGKSTLLNFIHEALEHGAGRGRTSDATDSSGAAAVGDVESGWVVTEFNAWRHQHIRPPWWSLMEAVFRACYDDLSSSERLAEYWWRIKTGRMHYLLAAIVGLWLVVLALHGVAALSLSELADVAKNWSSLVALALTLWGAVVGVSRSLLFGSAKAAQTYTELAQDPMETVKKRFKGLADRMATKGKRLVVFIDDLDRCKSDYVIQLLEGIQTLFKEAPVVFVIAADRHWINACYEDAYQAFEPKINEPGKPLGSLFLEKAFQFESPVPGISQGLKQAYWHSLLQLKEHSSVESRQQALKQAEQELTNTHSEEEVLRSVAESSSRSFEEQRAIREAAVVKLATPEVLERTEHTLLPYAELLDGNPRSMKRLVNAYSVNRALAMLAHGDIARDELVRWTILSMRWPALVERLEKQPQLADQLITGAQDELANDGSLMALASDPDVSKVFTGRNTELAKGATVWPINQAAVNRCRELGV